jgi:hypothetical protein
MKNKFLIYLVMLLVGFSAVEAADHKLSNKQIKRKIINESIENYYGNCPCPYNTAKNGSKCGKRSAWSRAGGESPICYDSEISAEMIKEWKLEHQTTDSTKH